MANVQLSQINGGVLLTTPAAADLIAVTDVSDTTEAPTGTTKPMELGLLSQAQPTFDRAILLMGA